MAQPSQGQAIGWQWVTQPINTSTGKVHVTAMATDEAGTTVIAGGFEGTVSFGSTKLISEGPGDVFVAWLDSAGHYRRVARGFGPGGATAIDIALAPDGTVTMAGNFGGITARFGNFTISNCEISTNSVAFDMFVARLDSTGNWLAANAAGSPGYDYLSGLALDAAGDAVITGQFTGLNCHFGATALVNAHNGLNTGFDSFVARLNPAGAWTQVVRVGGPDNDLIEDVAVAADGTAVVTGSFNSSALAFGTLTLLNDGTPYYGLRGADAFVARLSPAGVWTQAVRAGGPSNDLAYNVVLDAQGDAVIAGHFFSPTVSFGPTQLTNTAPTGEIGDIFVARLSQAGIWTQAAQSTGTGWEEAGRHSALAMDAQGGVVLTGVSQGPARFGNWLLQPAAAAASDRDIFVAWLDAAGTWTNALLIGGNDYDSDPVLAFRGTDLTLAGNTWNRSVSFGALRTTWPGSFVARYGKTPPIRPPRPVPDMVVPNVITPNGDGRNDTFSFRNAPKVNWALRVYNRWGQQVYANQHYAQDWAAAGTPAGNYYYLLERDDGRPPVKGWLEIIR